MSAGTSDTHDGHPRYFCASVVMGIEEKQAEMREMDQNLSAKRMELIELEKTIRRRQTVGPYI